MQIVYQINAKVMSIWGKKQQKYLNIRSKREGVQKHKKVHHKNDRINICSQKSMIFISNDSITSKHGNFHRNSTAQNTHFGYFTASYPPTTTN